MNKLNHFKATENRIIVLYISQVVLKNVYDILDHNILTIEK